MPELCDVFRSDSGAHPRRCDPLSCLGTRARAAGGAMSAALHRPGWFRVLLARDRASSLDALRRAVRVEPPRADRDAARWGAHFDVDGDADDGDDAREADARAPPRRRAPRRGGDRVRHVVARFDAHLAAVRDILRDWRASPSVTLAGYAHTVYASELFPVPLAPFSRRRDVRALIGPRAERLVFLYATASQNAWYRRAASRSAARPARVKVADANQRAYIGARALGPRDAARVIGAPRRGHSLRPRAHDGGENDRPARARASTLRRERGVERG